MTLKPIAICATLMALQACGNATLPEVARLSEPRPVEATPNLPPSANLEACHGRKVTPAVIETVTEQIMLQPAQIGANGNILHPAIFKSEKQQRIVQERQDLWFESPCPETMTPEFVSSLQRALAVRGYYIGPINGKMGTRTRWAVRAYQREQGLNSATLSTAAARQLGLVTVERDALLGTETE